jgi:hypothetical protein
MFDALGASLCVVVDVLSNFEVWKRSSVRHPFGWDIPLIFDFVLEPRSTKIN